MVHIGDYGFAHVWEIQQLKPGGGAGSESMIDSQDTLSTYVTNTERMVPIPVSVPVPCSKDMLPVCDHMTDRVVPVTTNQDLMLPVCEHRKEKLVPSANKEFLPLCDYNTEAMLPVSYNKKVIPLCDSCQGQTQGQTVTLPCREHTHSCDRYDT